MQRGKFITVEGQDGAGKSTNIEVIQRYLDQQGIDYIQSREPGGTRLGEKIRELLLNTADGYLGDKAELLLVFAARAQHLEEVIQPAIEQGQWVLCDRFTDATYAYQGGGRGLSVDDIAQLEQNVQGNLRPDMTILLDVPVEIGVSRAEQRSEPDRFEQQQLSFKKRVRDCYLARAKSEPNRIKLVDASQSLEVVQKKILSLMSEFNAAQATA